MTGPEFDEDEPEVFRAAPHPDDRLWRHPSEVAAMMAAHANAETLQIPAVVPDTSEPRRSRRQTVLAVAAGIAVVGAAALTFGALSSATAPSNSSIAALSANETSDVVPPGFASSEPLRIAAQNSGVAADALTSRVHDSVASSLPRIQAAAPSGMREGSGLFLTDGGYIVTSAELVADAEYVLAWTEDGQRWKASLIAADPVSDIAVLHIEGQGWPAVSLASSSALRTGQYAFALDHDENTIAVGEVVSVDGSTVTVDQPAAVPGSALVDDTGAVIAMMTANDAGTAATPAWILEQVAVDLIASGATTHTWLGVLLEPVATDDGMVLVAAVVEGSPAAEAGIRAGDLIDSVDGISTPDPTSLYQAVQAASPGDEAVLTVTRNGSRRIIISSIAELPE